MINKSYFEGQKSYFKPMLGPKQSEVQKVFESFAGVGGAAAAYKQSLTWIQDGFWL